MIECAHERRRFLIRRSPERLLEKITPSSFHTFLWFLFGHYSFRFLLFRLFPFEDFKQIHLLFFRIIGTPGFSRRRNRLLSGIFQIHLFLFIFWSFEETGIVWILVYLFPQSIRTFSKTIGIVIGKLFIGCFILIVIQVRRLNDELGLHNYLN